MTTLAILRELVAAAAAEEEEEAPKGDMPPPLRARGEEAAAAGCDAKYDLSRSLYRLWRGVDGEREGGGRAGRRREEAKSSRVVEGVQSITTDRRPKVFLEIYQRISNQCWFVRNGVGRAGEVRSRDEQAGALP